MRTPRPSPRKNAKTPTSDPKQPSLDRFLVRQSSSTSQPAAKVLPLGGSQKFNRKLADEKPLIETETKKEKRVPAELVEEVVDGGKLVGAEAEESENEVSGGGFIPVDCAESNDLIRFEEPDEEDAVSANVDLEAFASNSAREDGAECGSRDDSDLVESPVENVSSKFFIASNPCGFSSRHFVEEKKSSIQGNK